MLNTKHWIQISRIRLKSVINSDLSIQPALSFAVNFHICLNMWGVFFNYVLKSEFLVFAKIFLVSVLYF